MEDNKEITLKMVCDVFKKNWLKIITITLIVAIIASILLIGVQFIFSDTVYKSDVTFVDDDLSNGSSMWGSNFNFATVVKTQSVIIDSLKEFGFKEEEAIKLLPEVTKSINTESIEIKEEKEVANKFKYYKVTVLKNKDLPFKSSQYAAFCDILTKNAINFVKKSYTYSANNISVGEIDYKTTNFAKAYAVLFNRMDSLEDLTKDLAGKDNSFRSEQTKQSFNDLYNRVESVKINITSLVSILAADAISNSENTRDKETIYTDQMAAKLAIQIANLDDSNTKLATIIENCKPVVSIESSVQFGLDSADYYRLIKDYQKGQEEYNKLTAQKQVWDALKMAYSGPINVDAEKQAAAKAMIEDLNEDITLIHADLVKTIDDYNNTKLLNASIITTNPAQKQINTLVSPLIGMAIVVLLAVLTMFVMLYTMTKKQLNNEEIK